MYAWPACVRACRAGGHWYQVDDAWVTAVEEGVVRACQAFLLFYRNNLAPQPQPGEQR